ncbi:Peptidyl-prolyl cis-trans isomerase FKBP20-2 [Carex littledalei]|uniref:Peptidyl-prolyl cis-trans isomerase FKBP20-2 n=1 Tax=Carex littledalei TaxID=544730 RepID=A0A833QXJ4_9POAL|nr:Peptidyl-prolyl cis-trans isomerase FKBP20-2 [Carex littledalei]
MPRAKLPLEKIEDERARRNTFRTRLKGLFGKANQLAILCEAQVAVVVISETEEIKLFEKPRGAIETWQTLRQNDNQDLNEPPPDLNPEEEDKRLFDEYLKIREGLGNFSVEKLQMFKELLQKMDNLLKEKEREKELSEEKIAELQNTLGVESVVHQERALSKSVLMPNANRVDTVDLISRFETDSGFNIAYYILHQVVFHYIEYNESGRRIDSTYLQGAPAKIRLGNKSLVPGKSI